MAIILFIIVKCPDNSIKYFKKSFVLLQPLIVFTLFQYHVSLNLVFIGIFEELILVTYYNLNIVIRKFIVILYVRYYVGAPTNFSDLFLLVLA